MKIINKFLLISFAVLFIACIVLLLYVSTNDIKGLNYTIHEQEKEIEDLKSELNHINKLYNAGRMANDGLRKELDKVTDLEINLAVKTEMYEIVKDLLYRSILHIDFLEELMDTQNIAYPTFIMESILKEN